MAKRKRYLRSVALQLDLLTEQGRVVYDLIAHLKSRRLFTKTLCAGLQIADALNRRDTTVLFTFYPWLRDLMEAEIEARVSERLGTEFYAALARLDQAPRRHAPPEIDIEVKETVTTEATSRQTYENFMRSVIGLQASVGTEVVVRGINDGNPKPLAGADVVVSQPLAFDDLQL